MELKPINQMTTQEIFYFTAYLDEQVIKYPKGSNTYIKTMKLRNRLGKEVSKRMFKQ